MVIKNVLSCLLKDGKEVNAVMLVGRYINTIAYDIDIFIFIHRITVAININYDIQRALAHYNY